MTKRTVSPSLSAPRFGLLLGGLLLGGLLLGGAAACKKKEGEPASGGSAAGEKVEDKGDKGGDKPAGGDSGKAGKELADAAEPTGVTWKRTDVPFGSVELPSDEGWKVVDGQAEGPSGEVIMMQSQDGITPDQVDDYLASYNEVQERDAPKYARKAETKGTIGGQPGARVEGAFDNGTKFATRDFLIFTKGKVVLLSARIPEEHAAKLPPVIDHVARSLQAK